MKGGCQLRAVVKGGGGLSWSGYRREGRVSRGGEVFGTLRNGANSEEGRMDHLGEKLLPVDPHVVPQRGGCLQAGRVDAVLHLLLSMLEFKRLVPDCRDGNQSRCVGKKDRIRNLTRESRDQGCAEEDGQVT